jgi:hypothetical protein
MGIEIMKALMYSVIGIGSMEEWLRRKQRDRQP